MHTEEEVDWSSEGKQKNYTQKAFSRITGQISEAGTYYWDILVFGINKANITDFF